MFKFAHFWQRKQTESASQFVSTLEKVRDMREHSGWEPLTSSSSIQQRADRLAEAKAHIEIPLLGAERETREEPKPRFWMSEFMRPTLYSVAAFIAVGIGLYVFVPEHVTNNRVRQASVVLPSLSHTNLTPSGAERFARRALVSAGLEPSEWHQQARYTNNAQTVITFHHTDDRFTLISVTVKFEPDNQRIVCTISPQ